MSCDGNRSVFHGQLSNGNGGGPVSASFGGISEQEMAKRLHDSFGSPAASEAALEEIFDRARRQADTGDKGKQTLAEAQTRALFKIMRERGVTPPTHSGDGLPRKDAQFGYAAMYQTLVALRDQKSLPAVAASVQRKLADKAGVAQARTLNAIRQETLGRQRCMGCGRFAPRQGSHLCPQTIDSPTMQRSLMRRLKLPASAYPTGALANLMAEARTAGTVPMRHSITGELVNVTLDGLALGLTQGFVPTHWRGVESLALVEASGNRIVAVLDDTGLNRVTLAASAVGAAAMASGAALPAGTPVLSATGALPAAAPATVVEADAVTVSGGSAYNQGRFIGTEYRKARGVAKGETVEADGLIYTVGESLTSSTYWGSARHTGVYAPPPATGITVGRTLVGAAELLRTGSVYEKGGKIEVYDADGHLAAVFDPATNTAADVAGTPNASSAQMAAVLAYRAMHPANDFDRALATDLKNMQDGSGSAIAVADGSYIALAHALSGPNTLNLGGSLGAKKCPDCGKFMGEAGCQACATSAPPAFVPSGAPEATPVAAAGPVNVNVNVEAPVIAVEPPTVAVEAPQVTIDRIEATANVNVAAPQITIDKVEATANVAVEAPQVNLNLNADDLAAALNRAAAAAPASASAGTNGEAPTPAPAPAASDAGMTAVLNRLVDSQTAAEQRTLAILERLAGMMTGARASEPAPATPAAPEPAPALSPAPTPAVAPAPVGRVVTPSEQRTEQEQLVAKVRRKTPDPTMSNVPVWARPANTSGVDLNALIPKVKKKYSMNDQARRALRTISGVLAMAPSLGEDAEGNLGSYGLYGPPGSGKNELARQFAASVITVDDQGVERQGMPYFEREIDPSSDPTDLIGGTAIEDGRTVVRLGPVGQMLAMGGVVALNEVVRSPKLLTALQSAMEPPREIRIPSPEGGVIAIPVHPSSVVFTTWNPGMEGDADRPAGAPLARSMTFRMDRPSPEEQVERALAFFEGADSPEVQAIKPHPVEARAAVDFFNMVCTKLEQDGLGSGTVTPGARELNRFLLVGKMEGWETAMETIKIYCPQNSQDLPAMWSDMRAMFETCFGPDGRDVADRVAGASPARSS
jgi:hypothetical protein